MVSPSFAAHHLAVLPPCVAFALLADDLVEVVLGPRWEAAAPIVRLLLPIGALQASYTTIGWLMLALGRADRQLGWALIAIPLFLAAFLVGLPWGGKGVATSYAGANLILFIPGSGMVYAAPQFVLHKYSRR